MTPAALAEVGKDLMLHAVSELDKARATHVLNAAETWAASEIRHRADFSRVCKTVEHLVVKHHQGTNYIPPAVTE